MRVMFCAQLCSVHIRDAWIFPYFRRAFSSALSFCSSLYEHTYKKASTGRGRGLRFHIVRSNEIILALAYRQSRDLDRSYVCSRAH